MSSTSSNELAEPANQVGLIGAGALGRAFCLRLVELGHTPVVYDVSDTSLAAAEALGAVPAGSSAEVASRAALILTMLPFSADVEDALFGDSGIAQTASSQTIVLEASTIDPRQEIMFAQRLEVYGASLLDVGIAASPRLAAEGRGGALVGGAADVYQRCEPLLAQLFANGRVVFVGAVGAGKTVKLINNMVGAAQVAALSEGFDLGRQMGIEPGALYKGLEVGMANCWALRVRPPEPGLVPGSPADCAFEPDYPLDYMVKDLDYFSAAAHGVGSASLLAGVVRDLYGYASLAGMGKLDFAAVSLLPTLLRDRRAGASGQEGDSR